MTPAEKIENSRLISILLGAMGIVYIVYYLKIKGFNLNLNIVNFIFLFTGIILHGTPRRYLSAISEAIKGAGGIILQFPFYAGIMGIMVGKDLDEILWLYLCLISLLIFQHQELSPLYYHS